MNARRIVTGALGVVPLAIVGVVLQSCTSTVVDSPIDVSDAGQDVGPIVDAGIDTSTVDAPATDAGPPRPRDVVCAGDPCYVAVSGNGGRHFCGLLQDGTVRCWGRDSMEPGVRSDAGDDIPGDGALGRGGYTSRLEGAKPAAVPGLANVTRISVGSSFGTCARNADGAVYCWGKNDAGQLGRPPSEERLLVPTRVEGLPSVDEIALGEALACAIGSADRALYCWGRWTAGLGIEGAPGDTIGPQRIPTFRPPVSSLTIAPGDTIVTLLDDRQLATVGRHPAGERFLVLPSVVPAEIPGVVLAAPFAFVGDDGALTRWSVRADTFGQEYIVHDAVYLVGSRYIVDVKIASAEPGAQAGLLLASGRLFRWGPNSLGTLGVHPDERRTSAYPLEVSQLGANVVSFATTVESTCASLVSGKIVCFGGNTFGELGRGGVDEDAHPDAKEIE